MLDKRIKFEERYDSEDYDTTTLYFVAPKEMLGEKYPTAVHAEISVEFPMERIDPYCASVEISPTGYCNEEDGYFDYDWVDISLPYDEIEALIELARKSGGV